MGNAKSAVTEPDGSETTYRWPFLKLVSTIRLILGPVTVLLVWAAALQLLATGTYTIIGVILLIFALPTTLLEFSWLIGKCTFCPAEGPFCKIWHFFLRLDTWKRGAFYFITTILCFALGGAAPFAVIVGLCYVVLAVCYTLKTFQHTPPEQVAAAGMGYAGNMAQPAMVNAYGGGTGGVPDPNRFSNIP